MSAVMKPLAEDSVGRDGGSHGGVERGGVGQEGKTIGMLVATVTGGRQTVVIGFRVLCVTFLGAVSGGRWRRSIESGKDAQRGNALNQK